MDYDEPGWVLSVIFEDKSIIVYEILTFYYTLGCCGSTFTSVSVVEGGKGGMVKGKGCGGGSGMATGLTFETKVLLVKVILNLQFRLLGNDLNPKA